MYYFGTNFFFSRDPFFHLIHFLSNLLFSLYINFVTSMKLILSQIWWSLRLFFIRWELLLICCVLIFFIGSARNSCTRLWSVYWTWHSDNLWCCKGSVCYQASRKCVCPTHYCAHYKTLFLKWQIVPKFVTYMQGGLHS